MIDRLKAYIEDEFRNVKRSKHVDELKDELLGNLVDKFEELHTRGYSEEKAFVEAIKSIGNLDEIIEPYLEDDNKKDVPLNKDIDYIMYKYKKEDEYVFEKTAKKAGIMFFMALIVGILSLMLFYTLTLITYYELVGFSVQFTLLLIALVIYYFGYSEMRSIKNNMLSVFNNKRLHDQGNNILRKSLYIASTFTIFSVALSIPYLVFDDRGFLKLIITFDFYLSKVIWFLLVALFLTVVAIFIIGSSFSSVKVFVKSFFPGFSKLIGLIKKFNPIYKYLVLLIVIVLVLFLDKDLFTLFYLYAGFVLYDLILIFTRKDHLFTRIIRFSFFSMFLVQFFNRGNWGFFDTVLEVWFYGWLVAAIVWLVFSIITFIKMLVKQNFDLFKFKIFINTLILILAYIFFGLLQDQILIVILVFLLIILIYFALYIKNDIKIIKKTL